MKRMQANFIFGLGFANNGFNLRKEAKLTKKGAIT